MSIEGVLPVEVSIPGVKLRAKCRSQQPVPPCYITNGLLGQ